MQTDPGAVWVFPVDILLRRSEALPHDLKAIFATRSGTWHQVVNVERR